jgi:hypothetical protein
VFVRGADVFAIDTGMAAEDIGDALNSGGSNRRTRLADLIGGKGVLARLIARSTDEIGSI